MFHHLQRCDGVVVVQTLLLLLVVGCWLWLLVVGCLVFVVGRGCWLLVLNRMVPVKFDPVLTLVVYFTNMGSHQKTT